MRELAWTKEKPTEEGWYWYRKRGVDQVVMVEPNPLDDRHMVVWFRAGSFFPCELSGKFAGPIPKPKD